MDQTSTKSVVPTQNHTIGIIVHMLGLFTNFLGPLIVYLVKKNDGDEFSTYHAKEALNFQISMAIYFFVSMLLMVILIGVLMVWVLALANMILCIVAAVKASNGVDYRYPLTIRLVR